MHDCKREGEVRTSVIAHEIRSMGKKVQAKQKTERESLDESTNRGAARFGCLIKMMMVVMMMRNG